MRSSQPRHTPSTSYIRTFAQAIRCKGVALVREVQLPHVCRRMVPALQGGDVGQKQQKCANSACSCNAEEGRKYCSARCEEVGGGSVTKCPCGHAGCTATASAGTMGARSTLSPFHVRISLNPP